MQGPVAESGLPTLGARSERFSSRPSEPAGGDEEPYFCTATIPDGGIAKVSALCLVSPPLLAYRARSTTLVRSSALAQRVPSTDASPWNFQTLLRWCATETSRSSRSPGVTGRRNFALSIPRKYMSEVDASNGSVA